MCADAAALKRSQESQELRPPDLQIANCFGPTEFGGCSCHARKKIVSTKKRRRWFPSDTKCSSGKRTGFDYTIGRTPDRSSLSATGRIRRGEVGSDHFAASAFFNQTAAGKRTPVSRAWPIDGVSDYKLRRLRPDLTQIVALAGTMLIDFSRAHYDTGGAANDATNRLQEFG